VSERKALVRYVSPFCTTTWLPNWQARNYLEQDSRRWVKLEELDMVSTRQRCAGPPRIEAG